MMIDEQQQLETEVERARQAREITEHPLWAEAFDAYRKRLMDEWAASPARDTDGREKLWLMVKTASAVERHLAEILETGKLASIQLEQKRSLLARAKGMF